VTTLRRIIELGVPSGMSPEEAKYIQMSNLGSLLMIVANVPYMILCTANGWTGILVELFAVDALLLLTVLFNRLGRHILALFYFGTLLNIHLVLMTIVMGRETLLPLLIFFTAGGAITLIRRGKPALMILAVAGNLLLYEAALALERAIGPLARPDASQTAELRALVEYTVFAMIVVNALIGRFGAIVAENGLREEKKRSELLLERVRDQDRQKTRFFQNVSHELRTPLTLILGPLEGLLSGPPLPGKRGAALELISRNARRLLRLVNQLLDLSKIDAGRMETRQHHGNMAAFVRELAQSFDAYGQKRGMSISVTTEGAEDVRFDQGIVERILSNLLSNACKFTPAGGRVAVSLTEDRVRGSVRLSVKDSGVGIPRSEQGRIFERFYQVDGSVTRSHEGTGIGLSLVKELVQILGGTIEVSSEPGSGTEFVVVLPCAAGQESTVGPARPDAEPELAYARLESAGLLSLLPAPSSGDVASTREAGTTILVVEDNPDMRAYLRAGIEPSYHVIEAADGLEGLRKASDCLPKLIISDVMMPGMDGCGLCRALRADPRLAMIPVILLTAKVSHEMIVEGLNAGAVDYITKPFSFDVLMAKIRRLAERESQQERLALRDGLTGLLTRSAWEQEADRELKRIARTGGVAALAFMDIDDFKAVNDGYGHQVGDRVLATLAAAAAGQVRATDPVGRYGGEEVVLLLTGSTAEAAVGTVTRILEQFRAGTAVHGVAGCSFSAGVAEARSVEMRELTEYVARADAAMYEAKRAGKNRVQIWCAGSSGDAV
jgi:diguanylate cyclase (GGDEF)-like protein